MFTIFLVNIFQALTDSFRHSPVNPCHSLEFPVFRFPDV